MSDRRSSDLRHRVRGVVTKGSYALLVVSQGYLALLVVACSSAACSSAGRAVTPSASASAAKGAEGVSPRESDPPSSPPSDAPKAPRGRELSKASVEVPTTRENTVETSTQAQAIRENAVETSPQARTPKKIGARHVLIQWMGSDRAGKSTLRSREQALGLAEEVLKRAKAGADLGRLAVEYSDEPNAGSRGGSLGRFGKGQMVGAFDQVAFALDVGQISDIVETPFGFHVIQRTE